MNWVTVLRLSDYDKERVPVKHIISSEIFNDMKKYILFGILYFTDSSSFYLQDAPGIKQKRNRNRNSASQEVKTPVVIGNETSLLLKDLEENGDYVNSQVFPSLIKASIVNESLGKNILVIDLRSSKLFSEGHIKGAVNKKFEDLPAYFETGIKPFEYDKIIMVCEDGQVSSYTTSLLRLMGYGNVYSMRWGMSAWNEKYARRGG